jgi:hypothetical protein
MQYYSEYIREIYYNVLNNTTDHETDPTFSLNTVLNDNDQKLLNILSNILKRENNSTEYKELHVLSLSILSWILSFVSCDDNDEKANDQKNLIVGNDYIAASLDSAIALINDTKEDKIVTNLCLMIIAVQNTPQLMEYRVNLIMEGLVKNMTSVQRSPRLDVDDDNDWNQPIVAYSALYKLFQQLPSEVLSRQDKWSKRLFLLLLNSFSVESSSETSQISCESDIDSRYSSSNTSVCTSSSTSSSSTSGSTSERTNNSSNSSNNSHERNTHKATYAKVISSLHSEPNADTLIQPIAVVAFR